LKVPNASDRESLVKNISLSLLKAETPQSVLQLFENEILRNATQREIFLEEVLMFLFFFKQQCRDVSSA